MDNFVKEKLKAWNLERYITVFEENEVDEEAFKFLTPELIKDLICKAGPQAKFSKYWTAEFNTRNQVTPLTPNSKELFDQSSDFQCLQDVLCDVSQVSDLVNITGTITDFVQSNRPNDVIGSSSASDSTALRAISSLEGSAYSIASGSCGAPSSYTSTRSSQFPNLSDVTDIDKILRLTPQGVAVIHNYDQTQQLSPQNRLHLAGAIIAAELKGSTEFKLTSERLVTLANWIEKRFPKEKQETYYIPYRLDKVTNKKILAKGKLYDKYVSYRSLLRRNGAIDSNPKLKRKNFECSRPLILAFREDLHRLLAADNNEDHKDKLQWLRNCIEPWPTVEAYWQVTSKERINQLSASLDYTTTEYFSNYRALKQPLGHTLLDIDFSQIYPDKTLALYSEWDKFQKQILTYCHQKNFKDTHVKNLLSLIPKAADNEAQTVDASGSVETSSPEIPPSIALRILPLLLPCTTIKVAKKRAWRPSKLEAQSSFLLHIPSISHLETELNARQRKLLEHGLTAQPLAVIVGESLLGIDECYVCINEFKFKVQSPLDAIDITFKSFYALQLEYPKEAELTWMTLQKRVYGITGECDKIIPSVSTLIEDLRNC